MEQHCKGRLHLMIFVLTTSHCGDGLSKGFRFQGLGHIQGLEFRVDRVQGRGMHSPTGRWVPLQPTPKPQPPSSLKSFGVSKRPVEKNTPTLKASVGPSLDS